MSVEDCRGAMPLPVLWIKLGLPSSDKVSRVAAGRAAKIKSPFRQEKTASFSVWMNASGVGFCKDHGNGEAGYDEVGLIERALGMSTREAIKHWHGLAGVSFGDGLTTPRPNPRRGPEKWRVVKDNRKQKRI